MKITIKINLLQKFDVIRCTMYAILAKVQIVHVLLLNLVEDAKLNNCSTKIPQILQEDRVS